MSASAGDLADALRSLAERPNLLVALDFDGVLAPIVADRDAARPLPAAASALRRLAEADGVRLALVSGRTLADLRRLADPPPGAVLVASHGAELDGAGAPSLDDTARARLADVLAGLAAIVADHPGTELETKPTAGVLHTRKASSDVTASATRAALEGPARAPGVHTLRGKEVVELTVLDTDKGRALESLRTGLGADAVLYAGDDVTDEHAFEVLRPADGDVGIKVGAGDTAARWRVRDPAELAGVLHALADLRATPPRPLPGDHGIPPPR